MWFFLSLLAGVSLAVRNLLSKVSAKELPEIVSMWFLFVFSIPVVVWGLAFQPFVVTNSQFWLLIAFRLILELIALVSFYKALKIEAVSIVISLLALQPVLTLGTTFLINQQITSYIGLVATVLVSIGLSLMYINEAKKSESKDFIKASFFIVLTVLSYSLLEPIHAKAISFSNVSTYLVVSQLVISAFLSGIVVFKWQQTIINTWNNKTFFITNVAMGIVLGVELLFLFAAFAIAHNVAYVISLASIHIIITTVGAFLFLKESLSLRKTAAIIFVTVASVLFAFS